MSRLSLVALLAPGAFAASGCSAWVARDVARLRSQYPVVAGTGPGGMPRVEWRGSRPAAWVPLDDVSRAAVGAILVSEDWAFYQHKGYDSNQIREAIREDLEEGRFARGASTITQQVAKNVFLTREKNLVRKAKELFLAVGMERAVGKKKILETYLNIAQWGEGIHGIRAASFHYFGKTPSSLSAKEGAFLAMLLPSPIRYGQSFRDRRLTPYARRTIDSILRKMVQARYLTEEERVLEAAQALSFEEERGTVDRFASGGDD